MFAHGETVTRVRSAAATDPYSGEQTGTDWEFTNEVDLPGCGIAAGDSADLILDARDGVRSDFVIYAPTGSDVLSSDRVVIRGLTCEVDGRPFQWHSPLTGWEPGLVFRANIVEG